MKVGFLVNPYAGSGGRIGLKGSDNFRVYNPETPQRVKRFLSRAPDVEYLVPRGKMGEEYFRGTSRRYTLLNSGKDESTREDTILSVREMIERGVMIIVFVGGDGTARDVSEIAKDLVPVVGVPSGVKMHSGVFATNPESAGDLLTYFIEGKAKTVKAEVIDVDEEEYRRGRFVIKLFFIVNTISFGDYLTPSKEEYNYSGELDDIANFFINKLLNNDTIYIMGPGATVKRIEQMLGYEPNFLSVDIFQGKKLIKSGANYDDLLKLTGELKVVLTPIGGQGFIIGRGNQELGIEVLKRVSKEDIIILSSRLKLSRISCLRFDTGDPTLDRKFSGVYRVIVGYDEYMTISTCSIT
ncbi:MAG: ATP-NAD kinase family protein [Metallosphaera sp.]|uniref:ATP-NAD kinase family protein n=1 Tax=Metallosphaera sp. TaxID=2020860 RepID=UPI00316737B9